MKKENFLVDLDMFKAFLGQLNKQAMYIKEDLNDDEGSIERQIIAKRDDKLICAQKLYNNNSKPAEYYIFSDPDKEDAKPAKAIQRIELKTPQEVQAFVNGLKAAGLI